MKTLLLMRHAKSSWAEAGQPDFARPLNERGQGAAPVMGRFLRRQGLKPDTVVSSPAERARQTATLVRAAAQLDCDLRFDARIYEASAAELQAVVKELAEPARTVLLVGHNPGLEGLIHLLTGATERMPTAAVACLVFDLAAWAIVKPQTGRLAWLVKPKELAEQEA